MSFTQPQRGLIAASIGALAAVLAAILGNPLYATNDDAALAMIGAGIGMAVEPARHLVFSHYGYGVLLAGLSPIVGGKAHGFISLFSVGFSLGLLTYAVGQRLSTLLIALFTAGSLVYVTALLEPQFTVTAGVLYAAATACFVSCVRRKEVSLLGSLFIYCAIVLSLLIRPSSTMAAVIVTAPALLWVAMRGDIAERREIRHFAIAVACIVTLLYGVDWAAYYFSPEWRPVLQYNFVRGLFNDFNRVPWVPGGAAYREAGWSENDYLMFKSWFVSHDLYAFDKISAIASSFATQGPLVTPRLIVRWFQGLTTNPQLALMLLSHILLLAAFPRARPIILLLLLGLGCAVLLSALTGRPPHERVLVTVASTSLLCSLGLSLNTWKEQPNRLVRYTIIGVLVAFGLAYGSYAVMQHRMLSSVAASYGDELKAASPYLSRKVVAWGSSLKWEWLVTPTQIVSPIADKPIISIGALTRTPIMAATLQKVGVQDLSKTLCTDADVSIITSRRYIERLEIFCEQHYGVRPEFRLVYAQKPETLIFVRAPVDFRRPQEQRVPLDLGGVVE